MDNNHSKTLTALGHLSRQGNRFGKLEIGDEAMASYS
jgi:hypothetical protein